MKKTVLAFFMALIMMATPMSLCFAADGDEFDFPSASSSLTPNLIVESYSVNSKSISAGDSFTLTFRLKNTSKDLKLENILIHLSGADIFSVDNSTDTIYTESINANSTKTFSKTFYCSQLAEGGMYPIALSASFEYYDGGEKYSGSADSSMSINVAKSSQGAAQSSALTPQLLITDFTYGGEAVNGGDTFNLSFTLKNNSSSVKVQNIIVKLSGGEAFIVADGTDTISVSDLAKNSSAKITKSFKSLNNSPSGVYQITAAISYEYFDGEKMQGSSELTMSIPVVQPDRIMFEGLGLADATVTVDQETDCSFTVINSGQTRLLNGTAKLLDEGGNQLAAAYLGNIESGATYSSNYTLPVTFTKLGKEKLIFVFEYENENGEKKSAQQELNVTIEEYFDPYQDLMNNDFDDINNSTANNILSAIALPVVIIVLIIAAAIIIPVVIKKRKAKKGSDSFDEEI